MLWPNCCIACEEKLFNKLAERVDNKLSFHYLSLPRNLRMITLSKDNFAFGTRVANCECAIKGCFNSLMICTNLAVGSASLRINCIVCVIATCVGANSDGKIVQAIFSGRLSTMEDSAWLLICTRAAITSSITAKFFDSVRLAWNSFWYY